MKETVSFISSPQIEKLSNIITDTFSSSLSAISSKNIALSINEAAFGDADDVFEGYDNETLISAQEEINSLDTGLLFRTRDITMLADFMLAGDGESKDEIDDDTKDAVQEMTSQLLSSLNVPSEEAFEKKFSYKVDDVIKNTTSAVYTEPKYLIVDLTGSIDDKELNFRFFISSAIEDIIQVSSSADDNLLDDGGIEALLGGQGFGFDDDEPATNTPKNLDLLLDIDIPISVRMGSAKLFLKDILGLGPGNIVELEQNADDPIELAINDKVIARGEVVIVDGYFGFRIKEIVSKAERIRKLKD